ncbi:MAG: CopG family transcriptional regulator [Halobacteriaceae archaeon]
MADETGADAVASDGVDDAVATTRDIAELEAAIEAVESDLGSKVEDVRDRVIQVKRETDEKAPGDHDHESVEQRLEELAAAVESLETSVTDLERIEPTVESLESTVDELTETVDAIERRTEEGFENYETVLEDLLDRADTMEHRTEALGRAAAQLQQAVESLQSQTAARERAAALQREANRKGIREADCAACETTLDIALLDEAACPACETTFSGVSRRANFLRSHTLDTGDPPALEAGGTEHASLDEDVLPKGTTGDNT